MHTIAEIRAEDSGDRTDCGPLHSNPSGYNNMSNCNLQISPVHPFTNSIRLLHNRLDQDSQMSRKHMEHKIDRLTPLFLNYLCIFALFYFRAQS